MIGSENECAVCVIFRRRMHLIIAIDKKVLLQIKRKFLVFIADVRLENRRNLYFVTKLNAFRIEEQRSRVSCSALRANALLYISCI